jgi:hypothetical protein
MNTLTSIGFAVVLGVAYWPPWPIANALLGIPTLTTSGWL